jgi:hypothetical protein
MTTQSQRPSCRAVTTSIRPDGPIQPDMTQLVRLTTIEARTAGHDAFGSRDSPEFQRRSFWSPKRDVEDLLAERVVLNES